jgi:hypothetical protein
MKPGDEPGGRVVFCRFITLKNGRRLDAHAYGKKAFRIVIRDKKKTD